MIEQPRFYPIDGDQYVSVTTALSVIRKKQVEDWRGRIGNEAADQIMIEAAGIGSEFHDLSAEVDREHAVAIPAEYVPMVDAWQRWKKGVVEEVIFIEEVCHSKRYRFAGRFDRLFKLKGDNCYTVGDIKTSNVIVPEMGLQLGGYGLALKEMGIIEGKYRRIIIWVDKNDRGKIKVKEFSDPKDEDCFLYALALWRHFNGGGNGNGSGSISG